MKVTPRTDCRSFVVKSNALVEARYRLGLQESQIILWLLTQIHPEDSDFKPHKLDVKEFARLIEVTPGNRYSELRKLTKQLIQRVIEIYEPEINETIQVAWLSSAHYKHKQGYVYLEFSPKLKPYLLQLKDHFTKIDIVDTLKLKSIYAIRIFELLLQYVHISRRTITIVDLRAYCGIEEKEYSFYADFKRKIIEKAKREINDKTEYNVDYHEIKELRKVVAIEWTICKKDLAEQKRSEHIERLDKELRSEQIIIDSLLEYGFSKMIAKRLVTLHGEVIVKNAVKAVDLQVTRGKAKNPKAMLTVAIEEKWHPEIFKVRKSN